MLVYLKITVQILRMIILERVTFNLGFDLVLSSFVRKPSLNAGGDISMCFYSQFVYNFAYCGDVEVTITKCFDSTPVFI